MRFSTVFLVIAVLAFAFLLGCTTGTDGNGDVDGPYPADSLSEARAIATPLAEEWDANAFCFWVQGFIVDKNGILPGPENLASDSDTWALEFNAGQDSIFDVWVLYDGSYETDEEDGYPETFYPLPDYSNAQVKSMMNKADGEFQEHLGAEDYLYVFWLVADETINYARVMAYNSDFSPAGFIEMDADTLEILDASWW